MKIERKPRTNAELFTGTMADVSFLLVIFFVVTSIFSATKGIDFKQDYGPIETEAEHSIDVHVLANGGLEVDGRVMPLTNLLPYVSAKLGDDPLKPVILRTERETQYGEMMAVLDELRQAPEKAGFEIKNLGIPTYREMESEWVRLGFSE